MDREFAQEDLEKNLYFRGLVKLYGAAAAELAAADSAGGYCGSGW